MYVHYNHYFFDLDRTLWDFERNSEEALNELYAHFTLEDKLGVNAHTFIAEYKIVNEKLWDLYRIGQVTKEELRYKRYSDTFELFNYKDVGLAKDFGEQYVAISPKKTHLFPNAFEVLDRLTEQSQLHIITNGFEEVQHIKLKEAGLDKYFDVIMTSERANCKKPATEIFLLAMEEAGARASESIMIGDHYEVDVIGAENVGMTGVLFDPHGEYANVNHRKISDLIHLLGRD